MKKSLFFLLSMLIELFVVPGFLGAQEYTISQLTDNAKYDFYPKINADGHVVWEGSDGNDDEIFLYDVANIKQLTNNDYDDSYPQINPDGYVACQGFDGNDYEIFLATPSIEIQPFLNVPISGDKRIEKKFISAIVDHHVPTGYNCNKSDNCADNTGNKKVLAFDGSSGNSRYGENCTPPGYKQNFQGTPFTFNNAINYTASCGGTAYLNYDGHSGTDFAYEYDRPILAAADGMLEVPEVDKVNLPSPLDEENPKTKFNALKIEHDNGLETWYLHAVPE